MVSYRVRCPSTNSGWAWDVAMLKFYSASTPVYPLRAIDSGNAGPGWGPDNATATTDEEGGGNRDGDRPWGGRRDGRDGDFWLGGTFSSDVKVTAVRFVETSSNHGARDPNGIAFEVKECDDDGGDEWKMVRSEGQCRGEVDGHEQLLRRREKGEDATKQVRWEPSGPIPNEDELTVKPSRPLAGKVHGVCYKSNLHHRNSPEMFVPDDSFYHSENCEGLWVCVTKECGEETLRRACRLVRTSVPEEQRGMWASFASPLWAKDPGPMRLIVLDDRTDQGAGDIPELRDGSRGRNQTSCPFVFTSREDFFGGIGGGRTWCEGQLTLHEMTHGSDMVIRQGNDPYFHEEVGKLWSKHREKFRYASSATRRTITILDSGQRHVHDKEDRHSFCYAAENRDEFLAECHCIAQGLHVKSKDYATCKLSSPGDLKEAMPDVYKLLAHHFLLKKC